MKLQKEKHSQTALMAVVAAASMGIILTGCAFAGDPQPSAIPMDPSVSAVEPSGSPEAATAPTTPVQPTQAVSEAPSAPKDESTDQSADEPEESDPLPDLHAPRMYDFSALDEAWESTPGASAEALLDVEAYIRFQVANPALMSGNWQQMSKSEYLGGLKSILGERLFKDVRALSAKDPGEAAELNAIAAFFRPTGSVKSATGCGDAGLDPLEHCLATNVVVSKVKIGDSDLGASTHEVSFTVKTMRLLSADGHVATSTILYKNNLWVDNAPNVTGGRIVGLQNEFTFGRVIAYEHD